MKKKKSVLAALLAGLWFLGVAVTAWRPAAATAGNSRTFVAVLSEIGTIYARYDCVQGPRFSLGIRITGPQTTVVRFRAGSFSRDRTLQPGDPLSWFRYSNRRVEWLAAAAGGENGTVVGWVRVVGYPGAGRNCAAYAPPRVTTQIYPRRYYSSRDILRRLIG
jgi:hypothetical protein